MKCARCGCDIVTGYWGFCQRCVILILDEWRIKKGETDELKTS